MSRTLISISSAVLLALGTSMAQAQSCDTPDNPLVNCSFESGDFTGWNVVDMANPYRAAEVVGAGIVAGDFASFATEPVDGSWVALNGFDGGGPDTIEYSQDVTLPATVGSLEFAYRAGWDITYGGAAPASRIFSVEIQPSGGGAALGSQVFLSTNDMGPTVLDTGDLSGSLSLADYAGQDVRVVFLWDIPEDFTGPAHFQLDNVAITAGPAEPPKPVPVMGAWGIGLLSAMIGLLGLYHRRRK